MVRSTKPSTAASRAAGRRSSVGATPASRDTAAPVLRSRSRRGLKRRGLAQLGQDVLVLLLVMTSRRDLACALAAFTPLMQVRGVGACCGTVVTMLLTQYTPTESACHRRGQLAGPSHPDSRRQHGRNCCWSLPPHSLWWPTRSTKLDCQATAHPGAVSLCGWWRCGRCCCERCSKHRCHRRRACDTSKGRWRQQQQRLPPRHRG